MIICKEIVHAGAGDQFIRLPKNLSVIGMSLYMPASLTTYLDTDIFTYYSVELMDSPNEENSTNLPILMQVFVMANVDKTENKTFTAIIYKITDRLAKPIFVKNPVLRITSAVGHTIQFRIECS